jgi:hypothetical protein
VEKPGRRLRYCNGSASQRDRTFFFTHRHHRTAKQSLRGPNGTVLVQRHCLAPCGLLREMYPARTHWHLEFGNHWHSGTSASCSSARVALNTRSLLLKPLRTHESQCVALSKIQLLVRPPSVIKRDWMSFGRCHSFGLNAK